MTALPLLIVSGGAESVSASIAAWAARLGHTIKVFSLNETSLLQKVANVEMVGYASRAAQREQTLVQLTEVIATLHEQYGQPILAYPTEDDSLGLLIDIRHRMPTAVLLSRCQALERGGLDKAELFQTLEAAGLADWVTPTRVLQQPADIHRVKLEWGNDWIVKPAHKPWSRNLAGGSKLYEASELTKPEARRELEADWDCGRAWVAQPRLQPLHGFERSACIVRGEGIQYAEVVELLKYPQRGGSACRVQTQPHSTLLKEATYAIANALDITGIAELSFLANSEGQPKLLELNVRPWLQMELLLRAGFDLMSLSMKALLGEKLDDNDVNIDQAEWMSLERMLLKFLRGDGPRLTTLRDLLGATKSGTIMDIWSNTLPGLRWLWLKKMARRAIWPQNRQSRQQDFKRATS